MLEIEKEIERMVDEQRYDEAIERLDRHIERHPGDAMAWYLRGKVYWKLGRRGNAISDFEEAGHLDPASPAVKMLEMTNDIMDFYNKDLLNP